MSTRIRESNEHDHLHGAAERLVSRTAVIESRLAQRLEAIRCAYDLGSRALLSSHRQVRELDRLGVAPSPVDFWSTTANPAGQMLVQAATPLIDQELTQFEDALRRFRRSVTTYGCNPSDEMQSTIIACCDRIAASHLDAEPLNRLGRRWQGQLRRAATVSVLPKILVSSARNAESLVDGAEVRLLDQAPWAHDDRLLSAYELAHADVRVLLRDRSTALATMASGQPVR